MGGASDPQNNRESNNWHCLSAAQVCTHTPTATFFSGLAGGPVLVCAQSATGMRITRQQDTPTHTCGKIQGQIVHKQTRMLAFIGSNAMPRVMQPHDGTAGSKYDA